MQQTDVVNKETKALCLRLDGFTDEELGFIINYDIKYRMGRIPAKREGATMQKTLQIRTTVQAGGKVEIVSLELEAGQNVDVVISPVPTPSARSAWQVISERVFVNVFATRLAGFECWSNQISWPYFGQKAPKRACRDGKSWGILHSQTPSEGPGHRLFKTAKEVDDYIAAERASWNR